MAKNVKPITADNPLSKEEEMINAVLNTMNELRFSKVLLKSLGLVTLLFSFGCVIYSMITAGMKYTPLLVKYLPF